MRLLHWIWLLMAVAILTANASLAAKKKETKKAAKVEQEQTVKVWPDYEQLPNACAGLNMPIVVKEERKYVPMKCCPVIDFSNKEAKSEWLCEVGPWNKDQSQLPAAVAPPKG